jgi:hypothetical protein
VKRFIFNIVLTDRQIVDKSSKMAICIFNQQFIALSPPDRPPQVLRAEIIMLIVWLCEVRLGKVRLSAISMPTFRQSAISMPTFRQSAISMPTFRQSAISMPTFRQSAISMPT